MERNIRETVDGWEIYLQRNVHMYTHALSVKKGGQQFSVSCEDLPVREKTIGVWLYSSDIPDSMLVDLQETLRKWSRKFDIKFQIYKSKNEFVTNQ